MKNLTTLIADTKKETNNYKVDFFRLSEVADKKLFDSLLDTPGIMVYDELDSQLTELMKSRNPKTKFTSENKHLLEQLVKDYLKDKDPNEYGVWVYYPWSNKLVHILDENEYIELRTNRNTYKITPEEKELLSEKKVGVIGLSVGQSVSLSMAMERSFGELRIADFDIVEITNLNRIRTGNHNLCIPKTVIVAREIAEIDPYLKITCFHEGITEKNINSFLTENGKLDVLIDECDGLDIKILARKKAKELNIPVLMEASERGTVDVERFDLEPDRPILHGLIDHLDLDKVKEAKTNEEKIPYILPMIGWETISDRMKASMLEIEQTITTWPQLGSAVAYGGGMTADIYRRIVLDQYHESGRYIVDIAELVGDNSNKVINQESEPSFPYEYQKLTQKLIDSSLKTTENDPKSKKINNYEFNEIISSAILAPSGGNAQPWKWVKKENSLNIFLDGDQSRNILDFNAMASYIALGASTENIILKSHDLGMDVKVNPFPNVNTKEHAANILFYDKGKEIEGLENNSYDHLVSQIKKRTTNRKVQDISPVSREELSEIEEAFESIPGIKFHYLGSEEKIMKLANTISKIDRILLTNPTTHTDFVNEIRWSKKDSEASRNGIDINSLELTPAEKAGMLMAKDWRVISELKKWKGGSGFEKLAKKYVSNSSFMGFVSTSSINHEDAFSAGRAIQRAWLLAEEKGISFQPMTATIFLLNRLIYGNAEGLDNNTPSQLQEIRKEFTDIFNLKEYPPGVFLFRIFKSSKVSPKALRKKASKVIWE